MTLLLVLLAAFPGQRFATIPTGVLPEPGVWQVTVSHRFLPAILDTSRGSDPLGAFTTPNVRVVLDKLIGDRVLVGLIEAISSREIGVRAAYAPTDWLTAYPEINANVTDLKMQSSWFNLGLCVHRTLAERFAGALQPRYTTNLSEHFVSVGLGAKAAVFETWWLGLEAEPVLVGDSTTKLVPWTLAIEKQQGWHNFMITLGTARGQSAPAMFRSAGPASAYSDILDITKGYFRVGFNILRKF